MRTLVSLPYWMVDIKGGPNEYYEISVIRSDNKHGQASYGWPDGNKIIISGSGGPCAYKVPTPVFDMLVDVAKKYAKMLNESN